MLHQTLVGKPDDLSLGLLTSNSKEGVIAKTFSFEPFEIIEHPSQERVIQYMRASSFMQDRNARSTQVKQKFGGEYPPYRTDDIVPFVTKKLCSINIQDPSQLKPWKPWEISIEQLPSIARCFFCVESDLYLECFTGIHLQQMRGASGIFYQLPQPPPHQPPHPENPHHPNEDPPLNPEEEE